MPERPVEQPKREQRRAGNLVGLDLIKWPKYRCRLRCGHSVIVHGEQPFTDYIPCTECGGVALRN